jgi:hypothetical protein
MRKSIPRLGVSIAVAVVVLAVYAYTLWQMPKRVFWSPDEGGKYYAAASLHWNGGLAREVPYPARAFDRELAFYPGGPAGGRARFPYPGVAADGSVVFHWPIWFPLLTKCMIELFGTTGMWILPLLSGWGIALLCGWFAHRLEPRLAPLAILVVGLATPVWFYSLTLWEHNTATLLALLGLVPIFAGWPRSLGSLLALAIPLIAASALRIESIPFAAAALFAWVLSPGTKAVRATRHGRRLGLWLAAAAVFALLYAVSTTMVARHRELLSWAFSWLRFGPGSWQKFPHTLRELFLNTSGDEGPQANALLTSLTAVAVPAVWLTVLFSKTRVASAVLATGLGIVLAFSLSLLLSTQDYRSMHAVITVAPYLVLWPLALRAGSDERVRALVALVAVYLALGTVAIYIAHGNGHGGIVVGLEWGQRYLLPYFPLAAILSLLGFAAYWRSRRSRLLPGAVAVAFAGAIVAGLGWELRGLRMLEENRETFAAWERALPTTEPVVTDAWWFPTTLAVFFTSHEAYLVSSPTQLTTWRNEAARRGVANFSLATFLPREALSPYLQGLRCEPEIRSIGTMNLLRFPLASCSGSTPSVDSSAQ